jgi:hypothetical protein
LSATAKEIDELEKRLEEKKSQLSDEPAKPAKRSIERSREERECPIIKDLGAGSGS